MKKQHHIDQALCERFKNENLNTISTDQEVICNDLVGSMDECDNTNDNNEADLRHFEATYKQKREYLINNLHLNQNKLIDNVEKLEKVVQVLVSNWKGFDMTGKRLAKCKTEAKQSIVTQGEPIKAKTRTLNPVVAKKVKSQLLEWESKGIIRKSNSPWNSPIVVVGKKDGSIRICADFRVINKITVRDSWPLPNIESSLANLANQSIFSVLDAKDAYFALQIDEESIPKTAITTPYGLWEFLWLPFPHKRLLSVRSKHPQ